jgi:acetyltransferase-like isoleucine patch superfamily enzyme
LLLRHCSNTPKNLIVNDPLVARFSGSLYIGNNVIFRFYQHNQIEIDVNKGANLVIHDNSIINQGTRIVCLTNVIIGKNVSWVMKY